MKQLREVEEVVLRVIEGRLPFEEGLAAVCRYQARTNDPLAAFWRRRGFDASRVASAGEVPAVATEVFTQVRLVSSEAPVARVFRTSGTTSGARGEHHRISTRCYDEGAARHFSASVRAAPMPRRWIKPLLHPDQAPDSSLSHMVADLEARHGASGPWTLTPEGLDVAATWRSLRESEQSGEPVLVFTTAFALRLLLDEAPGSVSLPSGSILIETGGFKGRARVVSRETLYLEVTGRLGLPPGRIGSEYSMTELSSQLYSRRLADGDPTPRGDLLVPPAWLRVLAVDAATGAVLPSATAGLLRFVDLANVETVVAVQTADLGIVTPDGVTLLGRAPGAVPRGCGLTVEELGLR